MRTPANRPEEADIVALMALGKSDAEIARRLGTSRDRVGRVLRLAYDESGYWGRVALGRAIRDGCVPLGGGTWEKR